MNLYCDDLLAATIRLVGGDFPWFRGVYSLTMNGSETILSKTVHDYILTSQEEHRLAVDSDADPDRSILDGFLKRNQDAMDEISNHHKWATIVHLLWSNSPVNSGKLLTTSRLIPTKWFHPN